MRLFKPIEHAQAALKAAASVENPIEQFTTIGRQLGYFGYLSLDMVAWVRCRLVCLKHNPNDDNDAVGCSVRLHRPTLLDS